MVVEWKHEQIEIGLTVSFRTNMPLSSKHTTLQPKYMEIHFYSWKAQHNCHILNLIMSRWENSILSYHLRHHLIMSYCNHKIWEVDRSPIMESLESSLQPFSWPTVQSTLIFARLCSYCYWKAFLTFYN